MSGFNYGVISYVVYVSPTMFNWTQEYIRCQKFAKLEYQTTKEQRRRRNQCNEARIRIQTADGKMGEILACNHLRSLGHNCTEPDFEIYDKAHKSFDADFYVNGHPVHCKTQNAESAHRYGMSWMFQRSGRGYGHTDPAIKSPKDKAIFVLVDHKKKTGTVYGPYSMADIITQFKEPKLTYLKGIKAVIYADDLTNVVNDPCMEMHEDESR